MLSFVDPLFSGVHSYDMQFTRGLYLFQGVKYRFASHAPV